MRADAITCDPAPRQERCEEVCGVIRQPPTVGISSRLGKVVLEHVWQICQCELLCLLIGIAEGQKERDELIAEPCTLVSRARLVKREHVGFSLVECLRSEERRVGKE